MRVLGSAAVIASGIVVLMYSRGRTVDVKVLIMSSSFDLSCRLPRYGRYEGSLEMCQVESYESGKDTLTTDLATRSD